MINQQPDNQIGSDAGTYGGNQISGKQQFQLSQLQITHFGFQMHTMELDKDNRFGYRMERLFSFISSRSVFKTHDYKCDIHLLLFFFIISITTLA
ncbi:hypothetical protein PO124_29570 [Bacillus licheniformis]|nr:hypothetical protein [Bacillus licheniformis]